MKKSKILVPLIAVIVTFFVAVIIISFTEDENKEENVAESTSVPTAVLMVTPSSTIEPTVTPTVSPTVTPSPTIEPTMLPTVTPTVTLSPTIELTTAPTKAPTAKPTVAPTKAPTAKPTVAPTKAPTAKPTVAPTKAPTAKPTLAPTKAPTAKPTVIPTVAPTITPSLSIEYIFFGQYEQDNNISNGKEDIEWLVLDKQDDRVLVISKYALDWKPYNEEFDFITWEDCTLRTWLNNDFINTAFSNDEKAKIPTVTVVNDDNQHYDTEGGNDTQDKVFLLSIDEVEKYFDDYEDRMCGTTDYAKAQGAYTDDEYMANGKATCWWWLRSPGEQQYDAAVIDSIGFIHANGQTVTDGNYVRSTAITVRPALWVNLES